MAEMWQMLCLQVINEKDPDRLMQLIRELNTALEAREQQPKKWPSSARTLTDGEHTKKAHG